MSKDKELSLEEQVEIIRRKRNRGKDYQKTRRTLNTLFLLFAAIGLIWYYADDTHHAYALSIIALGMLLKVIEFFLRFLS